MEDLILDHLNELLKLDREAMTALVSTKVPCNDRLARHLFGGQGFPGEEPRVGLLGVFNAMIAGPILLMVHESGMGGEFRRFRASTTNLPAPPTPKTPEDLSVRPGLDDEQGREEKARQFTAMESLKQALEESGGAARQ